MWLSRSDETLATSQAHARTRARDSLGTGFGQPGGPVVGDTWAASFEPVLGGGGSGAGGSALAYRGSSSLSAAEGSRANARGDDPALAYLHSTSWLDAKLMHVLSLHNERAKGEYRQVVLLGDALDTRPFRLPLPPGTVIFLVAPRAHHALAESRLAGKGGAAGAKVPRACLLRRVSLDGDGTGATGQIGGSGRAAAPGFQLEAVTVRQALGARASGLAGGPGEGDRGGSRGWGYGGGAGAGGRERPARPPDRRSGSVDLDAGSRDGITSPDDIVSHDAFALRPPALPPPSATPGSPRPAATPGPSPAGAKASPPPALPPPRRRLLPPSATAPAASSRLAAALHAAGYRADRLSAWVIGNVRGVLRAAELEACLVDVADVAAFGSAVLGELPLDATAARAEDVIANAGMRGGAAWAHEGRRPDEGEGADDDAPIPSDLPMPELFQATQVQRSAGEREIAWKFIRAIEEVDEDFDDNFS